MSSKGQVVMPAKLRKEFDLRGGSTLLFGVNDGKIVIEVHRGEGLLALRGSLASYPLEEELMSDPIRARG